MFAYHLIIKNILEITVLQLSKSFFAGTKITFIKGKPLAREKAIQKLFGCKVFKHTNKWPNVHLWVVLEWPQWL